jgi:hypothetical protein
MYKLLLRENSTTKEHVVAFALYTPIANEGTVSINVGGYTLQL